MPEKYGVTKAAIRYHTNRQYVYRWKKRYDGCQKHFFDSLIGRYPKETGRFFMPDDGS